MNIDRKKQFIIWLAWFIVFPFGLWISYELAPPLSQFSSLDIIIIVGLMIFASLYPIVLNNTPMSISQWITLAVFLKFGLFAELILGQVVVLVVLLRMRTPKEQLYRYALNSSMVTIISVISGSIFYILGGNHDIHAINDISFLIVVAVYVFSYFILNQLIIVGLQRVLLKIRRPLFSEAAIWEGIAAIISFPVGLTLYFLYNSMGVMSVLLMGIPVISVSLFLREFNQSQQKNTYLQQAVEFGHRLTERLKAEEVLDVFVENILKLFPSDYLYVLDNINGERLEVIRTFEKGQMFDLEIEPMKKYEGIAGHVWGSERGVIFHQRQEWEQIVIGYIPEDAESVMAVPMIKNNDVTGVIFLASTKKRTYSKYHLMIVDVLCSYLAIALDNARHYEQTKNQSERDSLTNLYNARMMNEKLELMYGRLENQEIRNLSVLLIDIDHFKVVNDTYGHESGNKILCELSEVLKTMVGTKGILSRYGGEEFVILIPDMPKSEVHMFGEHIRETIENRAFIMYDDLAEVRRKLTARITVSIGVASLPDDTDDPNALLRYADRALYIGAKREGRNKVAQYVS